jgi:IS1 family transposase
VSGYAYDYHMNKLSTAKRVQIISALVEGNSLRSTSRMAEVSINTVTKLLVTLGTVCAEYHDAHVQNLKARRIQIDEIWSFVGSKQKNVPESKQGQWGDLWTWTAIDADTKLIISYLVGARTTPNAYQLVWDVAARVITNRPHISTDGLAWYTGAIEESMPWADFGMIRKTYAAEATGRYSPAQFVSARKEVIKGDPDPRHISTSIVERNNLTMRMSMRRFTRLTNGFSKKAQNHAHAVALHFMHYNFVRVHKTLRVTPAMEAGLTTQPWTFEDLVALVDATENKKAA